MILITPSDQSGVKTLHLATPRQDNLFGGILIPALITKLERCGFHKICYVVLPSALVFVAARSLFQIDTKPNLVKQLI